MALDLFIFSFDFSVEICEAPSKGEEVRINQFNIGNELQNNLS